MDTTDEQHFRLPMPKTFCIESLETSDSVARRANYQPVLTGIKTRPRPSESPMYYGVRFRSDLKWVPEILVAEWESVDKKIWLGTFDAEEGAARAVDAARKLLSCRKKAAFNFPCEKLENYSERMPPYLVLTDISSDAMFKRVTQFVKIKSQEYAATFTTNNSQTESDLETTHIHGAVLVSQKLENCSERMPAKTAVMDSTNDTMYKDVTKFVTKKLQECAGEFRTKNSQASLCTESKHDNTHIHSAFDYTQLRTLRTYNFPGKLSHSDFVQERKCCGKEERAKRETAGDIEVVQNDGHMLESSEKQREFPKEIDVWGHHITNSKTMEILQLAAAKFKEEILDASTDIHNTHKSLSNNNAQHLSVKADSLSANQYFHCPSSVIGLLRAIVGLHGGDETPKHRMKPAPGYHTRVKETMPVVVLMPGLCLAPRLDNSTWTHDSTDMKHCRSPTLQPCQLHVSQSLPLQGPQSIPRMLAAQTVSLGCNARVTKAEQLLLILDVCPNQGDEGNNGKTGVLELPKPHSYASKLTSTSSPPLQPPSQAPHSSRKTLPRNSSTEVEAETTDTTDTKASECAQAPDIEFTAESMGGFRESLRRKWCKKRPREEDDKSGERADEGASKESHLLSLVRAQVEDVLDSRLLPLISVLKRQAESERKYREKLLILKQQKLNLKHDRYRSKRQRTFDATSVPNYRREITSCE